MSAPIGKGDWVECVEADPSPTFGHLVKVGAVYCVEELDPTDGSPWPCQVHGMCMWGGLRFYGMNIPPNLFYCEGSFKPVHRPSESLFLQRLMEEPASPDLETV